MTKYDIRTHDTGVRVVEIVAPHRHGLVVEIREFRPEQIEPMVLWDGTEVPRLSDAFILALEQPR